LLDSTVAAKASTVDRLGMAPLLITD